MPGARLRLVLLVVGLLAVGGALAATVADREEDGAGAAAEVTDLDAEGPRSPFKGAVRPLAPARDFALRDQDGRLVTLRGLRGRVVVITPMYATCEESCPLVAQQIRDALEDLGDDRRDVTALALSVDPANDSPEAAKRFLVENRVTGYLDYLVGSQRELRPVWSTYGFSPQTRKLEHNSYVVLLDRSGRQRVGFPVDFLTPESLTHDLRLLAREPG